MRKIIIGLIAIGLVASLFWAYALIMDAKPIEVRNVAGSDDLEMPESGDAVQQEGDTDVRVAEKARYVILDPETKEITRVFGFDKLLNQGMDASRRQVESPYMIFYDPDYQCRVDADAGMFQVDPSGSNSMPKDARLNGNVKIHITPRPGSKISETIVEMDDLVFSSERSEFATDRKVHIKSEQVELKGTGLIVIFDPASGRIDYLRIRDLEEIRMQGPMDSKSGTESANAETDTASADLTPVQLTDDTSIPSEKVKGDEAKSPAPLKYYQCILEDNVEIKYGNEIVVVGADEVNIQNISFDQAAKTNGVSGRAKDKPQKLKKPDPSADQKAVASQNVEPGSEVLVTCDGGIILKPMKDEDAGQTPVAQSALSVEMAPMPLRIAKIIPNSQYTPAVGVTNLAGETDDQNGGHKAVSVAAETTMQTEATGSTDGPVLETVSSPPMKFEARKIDYDLLTASGFAHGPVRFTFYQEPDPNNTVPKSWIPVTVTADENAEFIADSSQTISQVVFNGNVLATRTSQTQDFLQLDNLHSEKLTIDLDEVETGTMDLSRLRMTDGKVYVESLRTQEDQTLSNVKLYCTEISYDQVQDVIVAKGPGKIEMVNNEGPQMAGSDSSDPMSQPSVAMVDNFTTIRWDMDKQSIVANGDQDAMKLAYYPILEGQIQKQIFVYSMQIDLSYLPDTAEVKKVFTDKSIIYEEWNGDMTKRLHYIVGQTLDYDTVDGGGWMKISGTPAVPCNVDGARMPEVFVHPVTGEIKASISTTPGVLKGR
ncbi:MAG: hypothetical protein ACYSN7_05115 [Planctomycetota bacterium]|jgi:hypothetical protein